MICVYWFEIVSEKSEKRSGLFPATAIVVATAWFDRERIAFKPQRRSGKQHGGGDDDDHDDELERHKRILNVEYKITEKAGVAVS